MIGCLSKGWFGVFQSLAHDEPAQQMPIPPSASALKVAAIQTVPPSDVGSAADTDDQVDARCCNLLKSFFECAMPVSGVGLCLVGLLVTGGFITINLPWIAPAMVTAGIVLLFVYFILDICDKTNEAEYRLRSMESLTERDQLPSISEESPTNSTHDINHQDLPESRPDQENQPDSRPTT